MYKICVRGLGSICNGRSGGKGGPFRGCAVKKGSVTGVTPIFSSGCSADACICSSVGSGVTSLIRGTVRVEGRCWLPVVS